MCYCYSMHNLILEPLFHLYICASGLSFSRKEKRSVIFYSFYFLPFEFHVPLMPDSCHIVELLKYHHNFSSIRFVGASLIIHSIFLSYFKILSYLYIIAALKTVSLSLSLSVLSYTAQKICCVFILETSIQNGASS